MSTLLHGGRLLQQYGVDMHVKIESHKLRWIRQDQEAHDMYLNILFIQFS